MTVSKNSWPLGKVPSHLARPELDQVRERGYEIEDPRDAISIFERKVADYSGATYGVAVDSCTHAVFLSLMYRTGAWYQSPRPQDLVEVTVPARTYWSIPIAVIRANVFPRFVDFEWSGHYELSGSKVYDAACRFHKGMYVPGSLYCLSFQIKKRIPIGRGGMILTDDEEAVRWLRQARYDGRHIDDGVDQWDDEIEMFGWHYYMTPEDAARGIILFDEITDSGRLSFDDSATYMDYPDLSKKRAFVLFRSLHRKDG